MSRLTTFLRNPRRVLAAGVACALVLGFAWVSRATVSAAPDPVTVAEGGTGRAGGAQWRLRGMGVVQAVPSGGSVMEPVPGAVFVVAKFDYESDAARELYCGVYLVGDDREWTTRFFTPVNEAASSGCDGRPSGTAEVLFEIPAAAADEIRGLRIAAGDDALVLAGGV